MDLCYDYGCYHAQLHTHFQIHMLLIDIDILITVWLFSHLGIKVCVSCRNNNCAKSIVTNTGCAKLIEKHRCIDYNLKLHYVKWTVITNQHIIPLNHCGVKERSIMLYFVTESTKLTESSVYEIYA